MPSVCVSLSNYPALGTRWGSLWQRGWHTHTWRVTVGGPVCGSKSREVKPKEAQAWASKNGYMYYETSAHSGVCVKVCVYMRAYTHTHTLTHSHSHSLSLSLSLSLSHTHTHKRTHTYIHAYVYCIHALTHACMHACMHTALTFMNLKATTTTTTTTTTTIPGFATKMMWDNPYTALTSVIF